MTIFEDAMDLSSETQPRHMVFSKMEKILDDMFHKQKGVYIRNKKIQSFTGYDVVDWIRFRYDMDDLREAGHLANLLCQYGYIYPMDLKSYIIKETSEYQFQAPCYWPSKQKSTQTDSMEYALYLQKRSIRNKQKHGLEEYETNAFDKLLKFFCDKKEFIEHQAREQVKDIKKKKPPDKRSLDLQERAFWRIQRPPPGTVRCLEEGPKRYISYSQMKSRQFRNKDTLKRQIRLYNQALNRPKMKFSKVVESYVSRWQQYVEYDPFLDANSTQPFSNPWISDDTSLWDYNEPDTKTPTELRVKKWSLSFHELMSDRSGQRDFADFLATEYSQENIRFWLECQKMKTYPRSRIPEIIQKIQGEFLGKGAKCEVNIDCKTLSQVQKNVESEVFPKRYAFEPAQEHIYALMKKDSYPRYLRSEQYKNKLLMAKQQPFTKKKFFSFGSRGKRPQTPSPKPARKGSVSSDNDINSDFSGDSPIHGHHHHQVAHHSYSTGNLKELDNHRSPSSASSGSKNAPQPSPGAVRRRSDEPQSKALSVSSNAASNPRRKSNLEVPRPYEKRKSEQGANRSLSVPKANSIAPWEPEAV